MNTTEIIDGVDTTVAETLVFGDAENAGEREDAVDDESDAVTVTVEDIVPETLSESDTLVDGESELLIAPLLETVTEVLTDADLTGDREVDGLRVSRRDGEVETENEGDAENDLDDLEDRDCAADELAATVKDCV